MKKMKSIEGLRRAVNEAEESNIRPDDPLFRHGVPSQVLKHVLRAPWQIENRRDWDKVKNVITFATSFLSDVSGTNVNYIRGADVYTTVRFSDTGEVETVTVKVSDRNDWPEHRGPSYTYTVNDKNRTGEVAHLFQRAEEEVRALLDNDIIDWEGSPRLVRRGRHWGGEGRVGESKARRYVRGRRMSEGRYNLRRYPEADPANVDYSVDIQDVLDAFESIVSSTGWYRGKSQDGRWEFDTQMSFDMISVYKILFNANGVSYTYPFDEYNPTEVLGIYEGSPDNLLPVSEVCRPLTKLWEKLRYSGNIPDVLPKRTLHGSGGVRGDGWGYNPM